jgi:5-methyltetrahydropteroyltriglutamate--homocysteine methyltransferase
MRLNGLSGMFLPTTVLLARLPGVHIAQRAKSDYYDYYEAEVTAPLPEDDKVPLGLADDYAFTRTLTDRPVKFSFADGRVS